MKTAFGLVLSLTAALAVAGCSETKMQDLLGSGKTAVPDETQVRTNRNLAMPPDLNLRPPPGRSPRTASSTPWRVRHRRPSPPWIRPSPSRHRSR